jgi:hypothetical protein
MPRRPRASPSPGRETLRSTRTPSSSWPTVSDTHYALLNKYHVIESHLLIVTKKYGDQ